MPKVIVSIDGVVIKEVQLSKERTTLGRRPYNDVVIDNLAVSGEHAAIQVNGEEVVLEDLNSTNGTYVNGKPIKRQPLQNGDTIEVGKYKIKYMGDAEAQNFDRTMVYRADQMPPSAMAMPESHVSINGALRVLSGAASGREMPLTKAVTTVGKPGVAVASISRRARNYVVAHVDGTSPLMLNGAPVGKEPVTLKTGDVIELAGAQMQFIQS
jgi:pSer/pThr/pTyr-binding forkhead associated (FHA) protein